MFSTQEAQVAFLKKFNISEERFRNSMLTWDELSRIADDFGEKRNEHESTVSQYANVFQQCSYVHSLGYRVKDTSHLIEKIIRKNEKFLMKGESISLQNYEECITDLMGLRILLLFKEDWIKVHEFLMEKYGDSLAEEPFAYIRPGDSRTLYENRVRIVEEKPYRSVHYLIKHDSGLCIEIQIRTLCEEAWGEVDHKLRYPYNLSNEMIASYLSIMNRATGMVDEMGTFINSYIKSFEDAMATGIIDENEVYNYILKEIENCADEDIKSSIISKIKASQKYKEMEKMSDLITDVMKNI